jgi:TetR/AcrR family transcriptional regulator
MITTSYRRAPLTRDPVRSRQRILEAAFREFSAQGLAGARVDQIARRAGINKRMLYHYFGDKNGLFREVLRLRMAQRQSWGTATPDDPKASLPYWFELILRDPDWIRLLEWEALQFGEKRLIDETARSRATGAAVERIRRRQKGGHLTRELPAEHLLLAMLALTWFPLAFPQLTRLITGRAPSSAQFRGRYDAFLKKFARSFAAPSHNGGPLRHRPSSQPRRP